MTDVQSGYGTYSLRGFRKVLYRIAQHLPANYPGYWLSMVLRKAVLQNRLEIVDADPLGIKMRFYPLQNLGDRFVLFAPNLYEADEFEWMAKILKPNSIFIDIGANVGFYSLIAGRFITSGKIIAFEPNPIMLARMKLNLSFNPNGVKVEVVPIGLADRAMEARLSLEEKNLGGSSIINQKSENYVAIQCLPLYEAIRDKVERIDLLKIDIEGADSMVMNTFFREAPVSLFPKHIIIESNDTLNLGQYGYETINRKKTRGGNTVFRLKP